MVVELVYNDHARSLEALEVLVIWNVIIAPEQGWQQ